MKNFIDSVERKFSIRNDLETDQSINNRGMDLYNKLSQILNDTNMELFPFFEQATDVVITGSLYHGSVVLIPKIKEDEIDAIISFNDSVFDLNAFGNEQYYFKFPIVPRDTALNVLKSKINYRNQTYSIWRKFQIEN